MNLNDFSKSNYLSGKDLPPDGLVLTVAKFDVIDMKDGTRKPAVFWQEGHMKPLLLNKTNRTRLTAIFRSDDTQRMIGQKVGVFFDANVEMAGEIVGGLRIRAAVQNNPQAVPNIIANAMATLPSVQVKYDDADVPF